MRLISYFCRISKYEYYIDLKNFAMKIQDLFYFPHRFPSIYDNTFVLFPLGERNEGPTNMISLRYSLIPSSILYPRNNFFHLVLSIHTSIPKSDDKNNIKYNFVLSNGLFHRKHNQSTTICVMKNSSISSTENNTCLRKIVKAMMMKQ